MKHRKGFEKGNGDKKECNLIESLGVFDLQYINNQIFMLGKTQMDLNLHQLKQQTNILSQETGQPQQEKMISMLDDSNSAENKHEKQENCDRNFQINSLALAKQLPVMPRTSPNFDAGLIQDQTEKLTTEKIKVEVKNKKKKKIGAIDSVFKTYYTFLKQACNSLRRDNQLFEYVHRRNSIYDETISSKIDLGVYNLKEIVQFCVRKKIISLEVQIQYSFQPNFLDEDRFIINLNHKKYDFLEFEKMYFTPFDHRLLSTILCSQFPNQFKFPKHLLLQKQNVTGFYNFLYSLPDDQYCQLCQILNTRYNRTWMPICFNQFNDLVRIKLENNPTSKLDQSYPFHMPPRKLRKKY